MAIDTNSYYYLVDPAAQFEGNSGKPLVGGWCCVYEAGTDNKVITLQDFDGSKNPFKVTLGSDGRCVMLVDIGKKYDLYVYDSFGNLAFSRLNIIPLSTGDITVQGLTKVYHDSTTLSGDGTPTSPLTVIGGGGGGLSTVITEWPVVGNGSQENPVTIEDITLLAHDDTLTSYDAEIEGKKSLVLGVNGDWFGSATSGFQEKSDMSNYVTNQTFINSNNSLNTKIDTKLDTTAFSEVSGNFLTAHQSLAGYATESFVTDITDNKLDTSVYSSASGDFALKSEIPSVVGFMEESKLEYNADNLISGYNGSAFAGQGSASDIVVFNDSNLPTSTELDEALAANKAICVIYDGRNYMFDEKTNTTYYFYGADAYSSYLYALTYNGTNWDRTQQVLAKQSWVNSQGFAKASDIPSLEGYATESWVNDQGFLTAHQSLAGYATESWVSSQGYAHSSDIPTNVSQLNNDAGYLTEHQSLTAYALKSEIPVIGTIEV